MLRSSPSSVFLVSIIALLIPAIGCGGNSSSKSSSVELTYTLTVNSSNPSSGLNILVSPADISGLGALGVGNVGLGGTITNNQRVYKPGAVVTLNAPPVAGNNAFSSWNGCTTANGTTCIVTMNFDTTVVASYVTPQTTAYPSTLDPTKSDEFDGAAGAIPDPTKWSYTLGTGGGWGDQQLECYTANTTNASLDGAGNLVIEALPANNYLCSDGFTTQYTSAQIVSKGKMTQSYGRIEARIKLPYGQGIRSAFRMLGSNFDSVGWPAAGEMDIAENVAASPLGRTKIQSSLHSPGFDAGQPVDIGAPVDGDYHIYGVLWTPNQVQYYIDPPSKPFAVFTTANMPLNGIWAFNHPFFFVFNVAVGGNWPGPPDNTTFVTPQKMYVDWVRVYN